MESLLPDLPDLAAMAAGLEASAVGLPLIATDSGGPNDIIEMCGNGELVDPRSTQAIAAAALKILGDDALWDRYAAAGAVAVAAFDWDRHARRYHDLLGALQAGAGPAAAPEQLSDRHGAGDGLQAAAAAAAAHQTVGDDRHVTELPGDAGDAAVELAVEDQAEPDAGREPHVEDLPVPTARAEKVLAHRSDVGWGSRSGSTTTPT